MVTTGASHQKGPSIKRPEPFCEECTCSPCACNRLLTCWPAGVYPTSSLSAGIGAKCPSMDELMMDKLTSCVRANEVNSFGKTVVNSPIPAHHYSHTCPSFNAHLMTAIAFITVAILSVETHGRDTCNTSPRTTLFWTTPLSKEEMLPHKYHQGSSYRKRSNAVFSARYSISVN